MSVYVILKVCPEHTETDLENRNIKIHQEARKFAMSV